MSYPPINQVFLNNDPLMGNLDDIDIQIKRMENYRQKLKQLQTANQQQPVNVIWDEIDTEVLPMTDEQKSRLFQDAEYAETYNELQSMVQLELLKLVKPNIENTEKGKNLLTRQLNIVKKLKNKIISDTNREMEMFNKFKEYSKKNPNATYEEFIKSNF